MCRVVHHQGALKCQFDGAARRFGVDPSPYIAASDHSAPDLLEALAQCPDFEPHALDFGRALFAHYDRLVASTIRLNTQWRQGACEIELLSDFDGIGWGEVRSFAGYPARGVGPLGRAAIFLHAGVPGAPRRRPGRFLRDCRSRTAPRSSGATGKDRVLRRCRHKRGRLKRPSNDCWRGHGLPLDASGRRAKP